MSSYMKPEHILMAVATAAHNTFETDERALASISLAVSRLPPPSRKYEMYILRKKIKAIIGDPAKTSRETVEEIADLLHLHKAILTNRKNQGDLSEWERQEFDITPAEVHLENEHRFRKTPEKSASPLPSTPHFIVYGDKVKKFCKLDGIVYLFKLSDEPIARAMGRIE